MRENRIIKNHAKYFDIIKIITVKVTTLIKKKTNNNILIVPYLYYNKNGLF